MKERYTYKGVTIEAIPVREWLTTCSRCALHITNDITSCDTNKCTQFNVNDCVYNRNGKTVIFKVVKPVVRKLSKLQAFKRDFYKFLNYNDALIEWMTNVRKMRLLNDCKSEADLFKYWFTNRLGIIRNSFYWSDSPEGHDFWYNLNLKWREMLEAMENQQ